MVIPLVPFYGAVGFLKEPFGRFLQRLLRGVDEGFLRVLLGIRV